MKTMMSDEQLRYDEEKYHYEMDCEEMSNLSPIKPMTMTNKPKNKMKNTLKLTKGDFTRINSDTNGNPRYYLPAFMANEKDARKLGAVKYRGKQYGAGWVFQTYSLQSDCDKLNECNA